MSYLAGFGKLYKRLVCAVESDKSNVGETWGSPSKVIRVKYLRKRPGQAPLTTPSHFTRNYINLLPAVTE
jgi:hypothetical protein